MRQTIEVDIVKRNVYGSIINERSYDNDEVVDVIHWLTKLKADVPEVYQHSVKIEFEAVPDYDGQNAQIRVYYLRPENDEEITARLLREKEEALRQKRWAEQRLAEAAATLAKMKE